MHLRWSKYVAVAVVSFVTAGLLMAQPPGRRPPQRPQENERNTKDGKKEAAPPPLPTDPKLISFRREFVTKVEKLASDYERGRQPEKAKACYEEILKLVPQYKDAQQKLDALRAKELSAERKVMDIQANRPWQDTGVTLVPGKPIRITATGKWTFNLSHELGPTGMQIPKELREYDLGALLGVVFSPGQKKEDLKPFVIGDNFEFVAEGPGRLMLQMHDTDLSDNTGRLSVEIQGTFDKQ
jgi:hypothetical protein